MKSSPAAVGTLTDPAIAEPWSPQVDHAAALQRMVRDSLWPAALALAVIYLITTVSHVLILDPPHNLTLGVTSLVSALFFLTFSLHARRHPPALGRAHALAAMLTLIVLANEVLQQQLLLDSLHQQYTSIILLASGALMLSTPWMALCMTAAFAAWILAIVRDPVGGQVVAWAYAHITCALIGIAIHLARKHTLHRLENVQHAQSVKNRQLEEAIAALHESESLFRQFADHSGQVFWINDGKTHQVSYVNQVYESLMGRPIEGLRQNPLDWLGAIHPDDRDRVAAAYQKCIDQGTFDERYRILRSDGSVRWVSDHGFLILDDAGDVRRVGGIMRDVTDRVSAEQELIQSEQTNRAILQAIPDMMIRIARDGTIRNVQSPKNFEALWVTGRGIGQDVDQLLPRSLAQVARAHIAAALETSQVQTHEYEWRVDDGDFWREWRIAPVDNDEVIVLVRDITARKRAEHALTRSRQRLAELIADIDGIVWECEPKSFSFTFVSPRARQILGYPLEAWTGEPDFFLRVLHPEDSDRIINFCEDRTSRGLDHDMNYRVIAADGRVVWVHDKVRLVKDDQGNVIRLCGLLIDVTESMRIAMALRENQVILDRAQEIASLGSWTWDKVSGRMTWSPQMYRICGITPGQFNGAWSEAFELIHAEDRPRIWQVAERAIRTGHVDKVECRLRRGDAEERIVTADGQLFFNDQGELERVIGTVQDITDLRAAQAERQRLEDDLKQAQKLEAIGTLATGVAHDFNNLLTAINGYVDLARRVLPADTQALESLDMIQLATEQAAGVTQSLLTFGHRTTMRKSPVDLALNLEQSLQLLRNLLPASMELIEDLPRGEPIFVNADAHQLQQVWLNLTINARDAMSAGGKVIIRLRRFPEAPSETGDASEGSPQESALITVTDHGSGMSEQTLQRIFEPYFTTKPRGQGTGLGLSIVHGIVGDHGGHVTVQSELGKGTTFSIQLPVCDPPAARVVTPSVFAAGSGSGQSILLAEDNEFVRAIITSSLQSAGYHVLVAEDGAQALEIYAVHRRDLRLLLLDTELPRVSGAQCLERIRLEAPQLPVILMSGNIRSSEALSDGEVFLRKPFQIARLMELVGGLIQQ